MKSSGQKVVYVCEGCGFSSPKWLGKCPQCGQWSSFAEQFARHESKGSRHSNKQKTLPISLDDITTEHFVRIDSGFDELNRVLGGGLATGSVNLLGGEPGIGKSTILLQIAGNISKSDFKSLYVTGEESEVQIRNRAERLGVLGNKVLITIETEVRDIIRTIEASEPALVIIDSIQTVYDPELGSFPGTIGQIRESTAAFIEYAKRTGVIFILAGHITKDGSIAGPKLLEHMVDTVLYFEGDRDFLYRIIRGVKNRFGPEGEIGVFEMKPSGLIEVRDPSGIFLSGTLEGSGSIVTPMMEGSRPFLIEVQGLVVPSGYSVSQKVSVGLDSRRISLIAAICEKKGGLHLAGMDLFIKILGGIKAEEAAVDLPVALALFSSLNDVSIPSGTAAFGELGLSGEVRGVANADRRVTESIRMGFRNLILPSSNSSQLHLTKDIGITSANHLLQAFRALLPR